METWHLSKQRKLRKNWCTKIKNVKKILTCQTVVKGEVFVM